MLYTSCSWYPIIRGIRQAAWQAAARQAANSLIALELQKPHTGANSSEDKDCAVYTKTHAVHFSIIQKFFGYAKITYQYINM